MIQATTLLSRLDNPRQIGPDRWQARCPAHEDRTPSLSIRLTTDRLLIHCWAGCGADDILAAVGLNWSDLFSDRWQAAHEAGLAAGHKRQRKMLSEVTQRQWATMVVRIAARDKAAGKELNLEDRGTLELAINILTEGRHHG